MAITSDQVNSALAALNASKSYTGASNISALDKALGQNSGKTDILSGGLPDYLKQQAGIRSAGYTPYSVAGHNLTGTPAGTIGSIKGDYAPDNSAAILGKLNSTAGVTDAAGNVVAPGSITNTANYGTGTGDLYVPTKSVGSLPTATYRPEQLTQDSRDTVGSGGSAFTNIRDFLEASAPMIGNYVLPGSSLITNPLMQKFGSEGAKQDLADPLFTAASAVSGAMGTYNGALSNYGKIWDKATNSWKPFSQEAAPVTDGTPTPVPGSPQTPTPVSPGQELAKNQFYGPDGETLTDPGTWNPTNPLGPTSNASNAQQALKSLATSTAADAVKGAGKEIGLQSFVDSLLQPKNILPAIGAVGSLLSANKAGSSGGSATAPLAGIQQEQQAIADQLFKQYQTGTLNTADAYKVDQWEKQQIAATQQYYGQAGLGKSDMLTKALGDVKAQAASMRSQAQNAYLTQAIAALGGAGSTAGALVTANVQQDTNLLNAQNAFFSNLARLSTSTDTQGAAQP